MNWLRRAVSSSIGRKFLMAITGLLLCGFLVVHLAGNILLYVGPEAYNEYAHKLHSNESLLMVMEIGLFSLFIAHIGLAISLAGENKSARGRDYLVKKNKGDGAGVGFARPDTKMVISGLIILAYLALHLLDFKAEWTLGENAGDLSPYAKAATILKQPLTIAGYLGGQLFLIFHLMHGVASAFQSLGINHRKYNRCIRWCGVVFAWVVGLGFMSFILVSLSGGLKVDAEKADDSAAEVAPEHPAH